MGIWLENYRPCVADVETQKLVVHAMDQGLKLPPSSEAPYGGHVLQNKDNDAKRTWGGKVLKTEGSFVVELQTDIFALGYWISIGTDVPAVNKPMVYDGDFGKNLYSGLKTFRYEHKDSHKLKVTGKLDADTAKLIKQFRQQPRFMRPGVAVDISKLAEEKFCGSATTKPARPTRFYQLPPSPTHRYRRYGEVTYATGGELSDVYHNEIWGARETIDAIISLCNEEDEVVDIGDISAWNGADIGHKTHMDGYGLDIRTATIGAMEIGSAGNHSFSKENSVQFARAANAIGFGRIITLCPHVTRTCNGDNDEVSKYVTQIQKHQNHFHMDYWASGAKSLDEYLGRSYCKECCLYKKCTSKHKDGVK